MSIVELSVFTYNQFTDIDFIMMVGIMQTSFSNAFYWIEYSYAE